MKKPVSISIKKFTSSVQSAVKAAAAKHPKFKLEPPQGISVSYLIRGFPVPEAIAKQVTLGETRAFAADVASHIAGAHPEAFIEKTRQSGAVYSIGSHIIIGIPVMPEIQELEL